MYINIESDFCSYKKNIPRILNLFQFVKKCLHKYSHMIKDSTAHCRAVKACFLSFSFLFSFSNTSSKIGLG